MPHHASLSGDGLRELQAFMRTLGVAAWLVYDFRGSSGVLAQLIPGQRGTTRRCALLIAEDGPPTLLVHGLDANQFEHAGVRMEHYLGREDWGAWLASRLAGRGRVAMEYSPGCALPVVSSVDAGTIELVRGMGVEVVSSADLIQFAVARWSPRALREHERVSRITDAIMQQAFAFLRDALAGGRTATELDVQRLILRRFEEEKLQTASPPIVAVNAHSGDPHYEVSQTDPWPVRAGDWLYVDLWAKAPGEDDVFSDITWCAFAGKHVPTKHREVFEVVRAARDAALRKAQQGWQEGGVAGWQLDEAARAVIIEAGFERAIKHRTGHSLSPGPRVHGMGMNLDTLETRDTRRMLAGLGFTIEPGVYLPEFGARSEINVYVDAQRGPVVTSGLQRDVVMLG